MYKQGQATEETARRNRNNSSPFLYHSFIMMAFKYDFHLKLIAFVIIQDLEVLCFIIQPLAGSENVHLRVKKTSSLDEKKIF